MTVSLISKGIKPNPFKLHSMSMIGRNYNALYRKVMDNMILQVKGANEDKVMEYYDLIIKR